MVFLGIGLAMDAFAVSVCKGLAMEKTKLRAALVIGAWFGFFQFLMPVIGFCLGKSFYEPVKDYAHWVAFALLIAIGANMIREALFGGEEDVDARIGFRIMLILAIATSIDALAVGISMAMEGGEVLVPAVGIGVITAALSVTGVKIGSTFGDVSGNKANILGGVILLLIGSKVLLEGLGVF